MQLNVELFASFNSVDIFGFVGEEFDNVDSLIPSTSSLPLCVASKISSDPFSGNSFICPTISGTTEIYIFGPAGAGIQNKICNIHLIDIVLQVQKYLEVQVFLVLQKYLEYQKQWNCSKLSERDTDMQNNIVKLRQRVRQG